MVAVTVQMSESLYAWLARKADGSNRSVSELIQEHVTRLQQADPEDPEFVAAMTATIEDNRELLRRLAQ